MLPITLVGEIVKAAGRSEEIVPVLLKEDILDPIGLLSVLVAIDHTMVLVFASSVQATESYF